MGASNYGTGWAKWAFYDSSNFENVNNDEAFQIHITMNKKWVKSVEKCKTNTNVGNSLNLFRDVKHNEYYKFHPHRHCSDA